MTLGRMDPVLAQTLVHESNAAVHWMQKVGIRWELLKEHAKVGNKRYFERGIALHVAGGGIGQLEQWRRIAENMDIEIRFSSPVSAFHGNMHRVDGVRVCAIYAGHRPRMDGAIVTALKQAGAFIVGKTTTTEFATSPPTETRNPHSALHTPGGSSAGSAAAVAAGLVPLALGTQTLGFVLRPASYCGVVGFKPSYGWFPTAGMKQLANSLDTIGWLASRVADCERVHRAILPGDAETSPQTMRFAFSRQPNCDRATPDAQVAIEACIARLCDGGLDIKEVQMPPGFDAMDRAANIIHDFEMHRSLRPELLAARDKIHPALVVRIERAARWSVADYRSAQGTAAAQTRGVRRLHAGL